MPFLDTPSHLFQNQFDCIDLSDNEIRKVECLAVLPRVKMILVNNNRITRCAICLYLSSPSS